MSISPETGELQELSRPDILVGVEGPKGIELVLGLLDTGADYSVLPMSLADSVGIELRDVMGPAVVGVSGDAIGAPLGTVRFVLEDDEAAMTWSAPVLFAESVTVRASVLGRTGFLEWFTATFDADEKTVLLTPNSNFSGEILNEPV